VKADITRPVIYAAIVLALLVIRAYWSRMRAVAPRAASAASRSVNAGTTVRT